MKVQAVYIRVLWVLRTVNEKKKSDTKDIGTRPKKKVIIQINNRK
jgi:hypothetical protein